MPAARCGTDGMAPYKQLLALCLLIGALGTHGEVRGAWARLHFRRLTKPSSRRCTRQRVNNTHPYLFFAPCPLYIIAVIACTALFQGLDAAGQEQVAKWAVAEIKSKLSR